MIAPQQFLIDFEEKMQKLANIKRNIQAGIEFKTQFTNDLKVKLGDINQRLRELARLISELKEKADNLEIQVNTNTTSIGDKERELQQLRDQITALTTERDNMTTIINQQEEQARNNIAAKQAEIDRCEADLRDAKQQFEAQNAELNALRDEMAKSGNEKDVAHAEQLRQLTEQSQKQLAEQESQLIQRISDCEGKIAGFEQQIRDKDVELTEKQKAIDDATGQAQNAAQNLKQEIDAVKLENQNLVERLMAANVAINDAADDLQRLTDDVPNAKTKQEVDILLNEITQQIEQSIINIGRASQGQSSNLGVQRLDPNTQLQLQGHQMTYGQLIKDLQRKSSQLQRQGLPVDKNKYIKVINSLKSLDNIDSSNIEQLLQSNDVTIKENGVSGGRRKTKKNKKQKGGYTYKKDIKRRSITYKSSRRNSRRSSR